MREFDPEDLKAYFARPWDRIARMKSERRARLARARTPTESLALANALWVHARRTIPGFPTEKMRAEDLAHHRRVCELLSKVPRNAIP